MAALQLIFLVFALVCFVIAGTTLIGDIPRTRLIAIGLAFLAASFIRIPF